MRSKFANNYARELIKRQSSKFSVDFKKNREIIRKLDAGLDKKELNEIGGYVTRMKRKSELSE